MIRSILTVTALAFQALEGQRLRRELKRAQDDKAAAEYGRDSAERDRIAENGALGAEDEETMVQGLRSAETANKRAEAYRGLIRCIYNAAQRVDRNRAIGDHTRYLLAYIDDAAREVGVTRDTFMTSEPSDIETTRDMAASWYEDKIQTYRGLLRTIRGRLRQIEPSDAEMVARVHMDMADTIGRVLQYDKEQDNEDSAESCVEIEVKTYPDVFGAILQWMRDGGPPEMREELIRRVEEALRGEA